MKNKHRRKRAAALLAALLCALLALPAALGETDPSDAIIVPETPKPWLAATATPAPTRPPSSLDALDTAAEPTATPTAAPVTLPEGVGGADGNVLRVLLIGTDTYSANVTGRSDTMILAQLDVSTGELKMVSFLRDLYVAIPGHGKTRLNAAYVYGGEDLLKQTLSNNFGVTVDRTVAVNFSLVVELVDRLGGVVVDVSEKERRQVNSILEYYNEKNGWPADDELLYGSGEQLLTGKQALCYSRIRKIDSDFQRVGRQQKVLIALYRRVRETSLATLTAIAMDMLTEVKTDLTAADAAALVPLVLRMDTLTITSLTVPINGGYESRSVSGMSVLVPYMEKNRNAAANFLNN